MHPQWCCLKTPLIKKEEVEWQALLGSWERKQPQECKLMPFITSRVDGQKAISTLKEEVFLPFDGCRYNLSYLWTNVGVSFEVV